MTKHATWTMAEAAPATEIDLAPLTWAGAKVTAGRPVNITNKPGCDNQSQFLADSSGVLFSSLTPDGKWIAIVGQAPAR